MKFVALAVLAVLAVAYVATSWIGAGWLLMPPRKPLPLDNARPGLVIDRATTSGGVPYLLCRPDATTAPGPRGRILRSQLSRKMSPVAPAGPCGTVVLLHGWGMRKENLLSTAERFCAAGLRCVIPDLPGHGDNPAAVAGFGARESDRGLPGIVLADAARRFHFPARPAGLWGISMGGAHALQAAAAEPESWQAVVVVSSFDQLGAAVRQAVSSRSSPALGALMGPGLSLAVRMRGGFWLGDDWPVRNAARLECPALVVHGVADDLIPAFRGRRLYDAVPHASKAWIPVTEAVHRNVLGTPQQVFVEMAAWYLRWLPEPSRAGQTEA